MFILQDNDQYILNQFGQVVLFRNADEILSYCIARYNTNVIDHSPTHVVVWPDVGSAIYLKRIRLEWWNK